MKKKRNDQTLCWGHEFEKITTAYGVGSYEIKSKFENVTGHAALSDNTPVDSRANDYEGTVYWTYNEVNADGTSVWPGEDTSRDHTFKSFKPDDWVEDLSKNHQVLSAAPNINNAARRRFENQRYKVRRYGLIPFGYGGMAPIRPILSIGYYWEVKIKRVVVQEED